jgi:hypothetical protein
MINVPYPFSLSLVSFDRHALSVLDKSLEREMTRPPDVPSMTADEAKRWCQLATWPVETSTIGLSC